MIIYSGIAMILCMLWTGYCAYKKDIYSEIVCTMCSIVTAIMFAVDIYLWVH